MLLIVTVIFLLEICRIRSIPFDNTTSMVRQGSYIQLCGFTRSSGEPFGINRIVGGVDAELHEFKWQVSVQWKYKTATYHICGASIIGKNWVLTAAHCTNDFRMKDLVFVVGDHLLKTNEGHEKVYIASSIVVHENYNPTTQENDISLIKIKGSFNFNDKTAAPVCLPNPKQTFSGNCVVTGWGKLSEGGSNSDVLQKVWVPIITDKACKKLMNIIGYSGPVKDSMLCAGYTEGKQDACQGDSGGPFVCAGESDLPILVGIVSWGIGCARAKIPGVYTEVSYFVDWINQKVAKSPIEAPTRRPLEGESIFLGGNNRRSGDKTRSTDDSQENAEEKLAIPHSLYPKPFPILIKEQLAPTIIKVPYNPFGNFYQSSQNSPSILITNNDRNHNPFQVLNNHNIVPHRYYPFQVHSHILPGPVQQKQILPFQITRDPSQSGSILKSNAKETRGHGVIKNPSLLSILADLQSDHHSSESSIESSEEDSEEDYNKR